MSRRNGKRFRIFGRFLPRAVMLVKQGQELLFDLLRVWLAITRDFCVSFRYLAFRDHPKKNFCLHPQRAHRAGRCCRWRCIWRAACIR